MGNEEGGGLTQGVPIPDSPFRRRRRYGASRASVQPSAARR